MMRFDPPNTPEQDDILTFALERQESLLINALAGTAKTTTVERVAQVVDNIPILYLVFNKRNQLEAEKRMPGHVKCLTANALCHGVWGRFVGRRLVVDTKKTYNILKAAIEELSRTETREAFESFPFILAAVRQAKITGYIPPGRFPGFEGLTTEDPFEESEPTYLERYLLDVTLTRSIGAAYDGIIDFDDQIYMPILFGGAFPKYPLVIVDEAQDLSPINHAMLNKLVTDRLIAVGDPYQSIYAFRGAVRAGMSDLQTAYNMDERTLSVSFRCPQAVVRNAWWRVPHFKWPSWAIEGEVNQMAEWSQGDIPDGAAIICRSNAPLLSAALRLIKLGRGVKLVGQEVGPGLVRVLRKLGPESLTQTQVYDAIDRYESSALAKSRAPASTADKCECLRVFASSPGCESHGLSGAIAYAEDIFKRSGTIQLLSGHKAKGLEWDTIYHLDPWRIPTKYATTEEDKEQELNVRYVIETRAKRVLNISNLQDLT
jgi:hypothetical protein